MWLSKIFKRSVFFDFEGITKEHIEANKSEKEYKISKHSYFGEMKTNSFNFQQSRFGGRLSRNPSPYISGYFEVKDDKPVLAIQIDKPNRVLVGHFVSLIFAVGIMVAWGLDMESVGFLEVILLFLGAAVVFILFNLFLYGLSYMNYSEIEDDFRILEKQEKQKI